MFTRRRSPWKLAALKICPLSFFVTVQTDRSDRQRLIKMPVAGIELEFSQFYDLTKTVCPPTHPHIDTSIRTHTHK